MFQLHTRTRNTITYSYRYFTYEALIDITAKVFSIRMDYALIDILFRTYLVSVGYRSLQPPPPGLSRNIHNGNPPG